jgi:uncharacterized protein (TIGR02453 family)
VIIRRVRFSGWPSEAIGFYEALEAENTRAWWADNKGRYETAILEPFRLLADEVAEEFGPLHVFRPYRDVRFAKDKTPYKTAQGAVTEGEGGTAYYLVISSAGLFVGCGYHHMAADQLERYRSAVGEEGPGAQLDTLVASVRDAGLEVGGDALKTAPRGWPRDHPRIELLRHKGLTAGRTFGTPAWLSSRKALDRITGTWREARPVTDWLDLNVGPSRLPPED